MLSLPVFVVGLLVLSMCIEALVSGVLCGVFISLFPMKFLWVYTYVLTLYRLYYSGYHILKMKVGLNDSYILCRI